MLSYEEMRYLVAFRKAGTLSGIAEEFHISQPTLTRAMKKAEAVFGVPLFKRTKNSIRLNDNGCLAAGEMETLLKLTDEAVRRVRAYDRANRTISIGSAAAVQLPELVRKLAESYPDKAISTELKKPSELLDGLKSDVYQLIILPFLPEDSDLFGAKISQEHLMFLLPQKHRFAKRKALTMAEMNGENMLLFSDIGFWADIVKTKMPDSRFLVQSERYTFEELIANSVLPCFTTDLVYRSASDTRVAVPIDDPEVNVTYHLMCKKEARIMFAVLFK